MKTSYSIYCDESCHLMNDGINIMVLGAVWCPTENRQDIYHAIREIKKKYSLAPDFEIKWEKVSPGKLAFYQECIQYFMESTLLNFRALVVTDKSKLRHEAYQQDHDTWYYKMYYTMLKPILNANNEYKIYLDIKDTRSADKVTQLHTILCNQLGDYGKNIIKSIQNIRSHEVELVQLTDLLIGCIGYVNRHLTTSTAKTALVQYFSSKSGYNLISKTPLSERKVNIFSWDPQEDNHAG